MKTTVVTPADGEPVSLSDAKEYLRIGHAGEDALVANLIAGARARIERAAGVAIVSRTLLTTTDCWPRDMAARGLRLRPAPVQALVAVRTTGSAVTDITNRFRLRSGVLCLRPFHQLPTVDPDGSIEIEFETGFGAAGAVPADLIMAVKLTFAHAFQRREAGGREEDAEGLPAEVQRLLRPYREARI
ncbi:MAG: hypothetical protein AAFW65_01950 [Pseudomonadota bacterium]